VTDNAIGIDKRPAGRTITKILNAFDAGLSVGELQDGDSNIGFAAWWMVLLSLPHCDKASRIQWTRSFGDHTLIVQSGVETAGDLALDETGRQRPQLRHLGVPYGSLSRLLLAWMATEVVKTRSQEVELGSTLTEFLGKLGIRCITGGKNGSVTAVMCQLNRLINARIKLITYTTIEQDKAVQFMRNVDVYSDECPYPLWRAVEMTHHRPKWQPRITLSGSFVEAVLEDVVAFDKRALRALSFSPLAIDLFWFIKWQVRQLRRSGDHTVVVPWDSLHKHMGSDACKSKLVEHVRRALPRVKCVYAEVKEAVSAEPRGLSISVPC